MSETTIGGVRVVVGRNGGARITVTGRDDAVGIAPEERIAVALALLGGITGELIERGALALAADAYDPDIRWDEVPANRQSVYLTAARVMLAAIVGGGEGR